MLTFILIYFYLQSDYNQYDTYIVIITYIYFFFITNL